MAVPSGAALVVSGTGLIGSKIVAKPTERGHQAVAASPDRGVNTSPARTRRSDRGRSSNYRRIEVSVVRGRRSSRFLHDLDDQPVKAKAAAGVEHHVALSIVNNELAPDCGR